MSSPRTPSAISRPLVLLAFLALGACGGTPPSEAPAAPDHADHADHSAHKGPADHGAHAAPEKPATAEAVKGTVEGAKATHLMGARVRAMPPGSKATGAFFILHNTSEHDAAVIGGSSPAAKTVELHTHVEENGVFQMRQIDRIDVPAGQQVTLQPGGLHVMLIDPTGPLHVGDTVSLTLEFEGGHSQAFDIPVQEIGAGDHGGHGDHGDHGGH
jgi:copper(I)-binding protein